MSNVTGVVGKICKVTGVVGKIFEKNINTARGPSKVFSLNIDGIWYNCGFDRPECADGDTVAVEYVRDRYGNKVQSITVTGDGTSEDESEGGLDRSISIIRQNSLAHATAVVLASKPKATDDVPAKIIEVARKFEAYSAGYEVEDKVFGDPVEEAMS